MAKITFNRPVDGAVFVATHFGAKVFPLVPFGKTPSAQGWQDWATDDESRIRQYATANPTANWGVYAGGSGLLILDLDKKDGRDGEASLIELETEYGAIPTTFSVRTVSGGKHIYLYGSAKNSVNEFGAGIDIRGQGGYVVAPGSQIRDSHGELTGGYTVESDAPIIPAPAWVSARAGERQKPALDRPADQFVEGSITEGGRDIELTRWAGVLRGSGLTYDEMLPALTQMNLTRCNPPLDQDQVDKIARSIAKKPRGAAKALSDFTTLDPADALKKSSPKPLSSYAGPAPKREWIIPEWLPMGEVSSLYGSGGLGKSLLALQLAIAIGTGEPWLGLPVARQMPVLYVACEDTDAELHRRKNQILKEEDFNAALLNAPVYLWSRVGEPNDIAREHGEDVVEGEFMGVLKEALKQFEGVPVALMLDTISDVYLGTENAREKVNKFVKQHMGGLVRDHKLTVLILAHPSRTGQNTGDMLSGSTAWENAVRNRLTLRTHKDNPNVTVLGRIKSNYAKAGEEIYLEYDNGRFVPVTQPASARDAEMRDIVSAITKFAPEGETIPLFTLARKIQQGEPHLFGGVSHSTVERRVQQALKTPLEVGYLIYQYNEVQKDGKNFRGVTTSATSNDPEVLKLLE